MRLACLLSVIISPAIAGACATSDITGCVAINSTSCTCSECLVNGYVVQPTAAGACTPCASYSGTCGGEVHCTGDGSAPVCADVSVTLQLTDWHSDHGDYVHVCGDFNNWCDHFDKVGFEAQTQWRMTMSSGDAAFDPSFNRSLCTASWCTSCSCKSHSGLASP